MVVFNHATNALPFVRLRAVFQRMLRWFLLGATFLSPFGAEWQSISGGRWQQIPMPEGGTSGFCLMDPLSIGVVFTNYLSDAQAATNRTLYNGSGVATGDIDGDGRIDLVFAGLQNRLEIFKNLGAWQFTNVTAAAGIKITNLLCRGVVLADVDGDGALDLLASANGKGVFCWRNDGTGKFTEFTKEAGTSSPFGSLTMTLGDVDGNGSLDLYVANNRTDDIRDRGQVQLNLVGGRPTVPPALRNRLVIHNGQILEFGEPDVFLMNDGRGHFRPANWTNIFLDDKGQPLRGAPLDWGLSAAFRDLNGDLAPDLYVCNDFWTPDRIWLNDGSGRFRAAAPLAFRQTSGSSMGVDMADLNFDGSPEIFVLDMLSRSPAWRKRQLEAQQSFPNSPGTIEDRPQSLRNTLFVSRQDETYAEIANFAGVAASEWAWQPVFMDVDLDGNADLLITSGHARDVQDRDASLQIRARQRSYDSITNLVERRRAFTADLLEHMRLYPELKTPIVAFRNRGDLTFEEVTQNWGTAQAGIHHGIATADFDGDGDLDFAVNKLNGPAALYRNESASSRVVIRLKGKTPNTQGIGALLTLRHGAVPVQRQEIVAGGRYLSGSDPLVVFAAGTNGAPMTLEVRWRNGTTRAVSGISANRYFEIAESSDLDLPSSAPAKAAPRGWFVDASSKLGHSHQEGLFDDFARQSLLPHRLSQLGPGVCWVDLDSDGWEDLVIGTGAGGLLGAFQNDQKGGFGRWSTAPFNQALPRDTTTLLNLPTHEGKSSLFVGVASYEDGMTNTASLLRYDLQIGARVAAWPDLPGSIGPLSAADYDADGDLDVFAGARVVPGQWPRAAGNVLLRKDQQTWTPFDFSAEIMGSNAPVSASLWTDLDGDGFTELVVAGELGSIRVFKNNRGELEIGEWLVASPGGEKGPLENLTGWWTSLAAGDFDGDGRMDLVAGNWGENSDRHASAKRPLKIFTGTFPPASSVGVIETVFDSVIGSYVPARPLDDFVSDLPFLTGKFASHRAYSETGIDQFLGERKSLATEHSVSTLQTVLLLNRKTHFELRPLPREAQLAPAFGLAVADFNLDGNEDVFLAQNFFATRLGVPRLDAGRGLVLSGDGQGGFTSVPGQESGVLVYGEQRGAATADFDNDGRPDLVVTQNGAETKLYRNNAEKRGLRVRVSGPPLNRDGIGCVLRLKRGGRFSAAREIHAGSGYWSQDSPVTILTIPEGEEPLELEARWPGGNLYSVRVPEGAMEYKVMF